MRYFKRLILFSCLPLPLPLPLLANYQLFADSVDKTSNILIVQEESKKHETFLNSGRQKLKDNDYLGAIKDFTQAIEIDSKDWRSYHNRAISKWELEDYKGAISDYSKAMYI